MSWNLGVLILVLLRQPSEYLVGPKSMAGAQEENQGQHRAHSPFYSILPVERITYLKKKA